MNPEEKEILAILSDRIWVITNQIIADYPVFNKPKTIKSSRRMTKFELQRFIRLLVRWYPHASEYYHIADYRKTDKIAFRMKVKK